MILTFECTFDAMHNRNVLNCPRNLASCFFVARLDIGTCSGAGVNVSRRRKVHVCFLSMPQLHNIPFGFLPRNHKLTSPRVLQIQLHPYGALTEFEPFYKLLRVDRDIIFTNLVEWILQMLLDVVKAHENGGEKNRHHVHQAS
jgi:hypothetical protein